MFSFIKFFQNLIAKLQSNKRVWFTTIFVISILGITLSVVSLTLLTSSTSKDVYKTQANEYKKRYDNFFQMQLSEFRKMSVFLLNNQEFTDLAAGDNIDEISSYIDNKNSGLQDSGFDYIEITYYSTQNSTLTTLVSSVIESSNNVYGMTIMNDGVYYVYLEPIFVQEQLVGVLQFKSGLNEMYANFIYLEQEFAFLLEENLIANIALRNQEGNYDEFGTRYLYNNKVFTQPYLKDIGALEQPVLRDFYDNGYIVTDNYYMAYTDVVDIKGANIGIILYGERIDKEGSFINITSEVTSQVVIVALGLIVSVLLFMF